MEQTAAKPRSGKAKNEVLGQIDLGVGLPDGAWDKVARAGIPSAHAETPSWQQQTALDRMTPKPRPGYVQRWVRIVDVEGRPDVANKHEALAEGWRPRRAETLREDEAHMPVYDPGDGQGGVLAFKGQLVLFEIPEQLHQQAMRRLRAEQEQINRVIHQQTKQASGLPEQYATLDHEIGGRSAADLIDS